MLATISAHYDPGNDACSASHTPTISTITRIIAGEHYGGTQPVDGGIGTVLTSKCSGDLRELPLGRPESKRMLLSLELRFVFLANTKSGSTSLEQILWRDSQVQLRHDPELKHMSLDTFDELFTPLLRQSGLNLGDLFVFGVLREPLSWVTSWFNYRSRPQLDGKARSLADVEFSEFVRRFDSGPPPPLGYQSANFMLDGTLAVDALLDHARLPAAFAAIADQLGRDVSSNVGRVRRNTSETVRCRPDDIADADRHVLEQHYASDIALYKQVAMAPDGVYRPQRP